MKLKPGLLKLSHSSLAVNTFTLSWNLMFASKLSELNLEVRLKADFLSVKEKIELAEK